MSFAAAHGPSASAVDMLARGGERGAWSTFIHPAGPCVGNGGKGKGGAGGDGVTVKVVVRCRPMNTKEKNEDRKPIIDIQKNLVDITRTLDLGPNPSAEELNNNRKSFTFDMAFDDKTEQKNFYEEACSPLVESIFEGFNGTIFAYGQTGSGKTFSMQGPAGVPEMRGVIPLSFDHVYENIRLSEGVEYLVRCSYLEIYNEEIRDLLVDYTGGTTKGEKCELKEDPSKGVYVKGLSNVVVQDEAMLHALVNKGLDNRTVGATLMNAGSSRSHSIFTLVLEMNVPGEDGKDHFKMGKLNLVDLAGSERQQKTGATGDRLKEGCKINLSLSALGNVISALVDGRGKHIPYRDSKLTRLLQDSLGGNTKTLMIAAISPADYNYDETLSTLRYANRAKNIKNKPRVNEDPKDTMLREYKSEIERLKDLLAKHQDGGGPAPPVASAAGRGAEEEEEEESPAKKSDVFSTSDGGKPGLRRAGEAGGGAREVIREKVIVEKVVHVADPDAKKTAQRAAALDEYNRALEDRQAALGAELSAEREKAAAATSQHAQLAAQLERLQNRVVGGSLPRGGSSKSKLLAEADDDEPTTTNLLLLGGLHPAVAPTEAELAQKRDVRQRRLDRRRKKMEAEAEELRLRAEAERLEAEAEIEMAKTTAGDEKAKADRRRKRAERAEKKLQAAQREIADLTAEFQMERDGHLDLLREANREAQLWREACEQVLHAKDVKRVWERSVYDEENDRWDLPELLRPKQRTPTDTTAQHSNKLPSIGQQTTIAHAAAATTTATTTTATTTTTAGPASSSSSSTTARAASSSGRTEKKNNNSNNNNNNNNNNKHRASPRSLEVGEEATPRIESANGRASSASGAPRHKKKSSSKDHRKKDGSSSSSSSTSRTGPSSPNHNCLIMLGDASANDDDFAAPSPWAGETQQLTLEETDRPDAKQRTRLKSRGGNRRSSAEANGSRPVSRGVGGPCENPNTFEGRCLLPDGFAR